MGEELSRDPGWGDGSGQEETGCCAVPLRRPPGGVAEPLRARALHLPAGSSLPGLTCALGKEAQGRPSLGRHRTPWFQTGLLISDGSATGRPRCLHLESSRKAWVLRGEELGKPALQ